MPRTRSSPRGSGEFGAERYLYLAPRIRRPDRTGSSPPARAGPRASRCAWDRAAVSCHQHETPGRATEEWGSQNACEEWGSQNAYHSSTCRAPSTVPRSSAPPACPCSRSPEQLRSAHSERCTPGSHPSGRSPRFPGHRRTDRRRCSRCGPTTPGTPRPRLPQSSATRGCLAGAV